ncbi:unnamed protein product [Linum trigynum]|uniref:Uncharacterized protein n=1 Tax=Linum trigynum TaxID=586398 RepID=A0AAV2FC66_9ROSI
MNKEGPQIVQDMEGTQTEYDVLSEATTSQPQGPQPDVIQVIAEAPPATDEKEKRKGPTSCFRSYNMSLNPCFKMVCRNTIKRIVLAFMILKNKLQWSF